MIRALSRVAYPSTLWLSCAASSRCLIRFLARPPYCEGWWGCSSGMCSKHFQRQSTGLSCTCSVLKAKQVHKVLTLFTCAHGHCQLLTVPRECATNSRCSSRLSISNVFCTTAKRSFGRNSGKKMWQLTYKHEYIDGTQKNAVMALGITVLQVELACSRCIICLGTQRVCIFVNLGFRRYFEYIGTNIYHVAPW